MREFFKGHSQFKRKNRPNDKDRRVGIQDRAGEY